MDGLRLALIIVGIAVVAVVYWWTAHRRRLDREAGDFDRFDAWADEELDPLAPSASNDRPGTDRDGDAAGGWAASADELTEPNLSLAQVRDALQDASARPTVAFDDRGQRAGNVNSASTAPVSKHHRDPEAGSEAEDTSAAVAAAAPPSPAAWTEPQVGPVSESDRKVAVDDDDPTNEQKLPGEARVIADLEAIADSLDARAEPRIGALDGIELHAQHPQPTIRQSLASGAREQQQDRKQQGERGDQSRQSSTVKAAADADAEMVVVLNVMARADRSFAGPSLKQALEDAGLRHGEMQLYHYRAETQAGGTPPIFSALNVVKPGTLDLGEFGAMQTPGIALVLRVAGLERPSEAFELMLVAARRIAGELDGQVCDETRSTLTGQALNHLRERIAAAAFRAQSGA